MNHPNKEELITLLYDELPPEKKAELDAHLKTCAACHAQVADWQKIKSELQTWRFPVAKTTSHFSEVSRWAAAAAIMICIGFGIGRFTAPQPDVSALRSALESQLRETFQQELQTARAADRKEVISMLRDVETQRIAEYTQLRQDLETVAVLADEKLTKTERALSQANPFAQNESNSK